MKNLLLVVLFMSIIMMSCAGDKNLRLEKKKLLQAIKLIEGQKIKRGETTLDEVRNIFKDDFNLVAEGDLSQGVIRGIVRFYPSTKDENGNIVCYSGWYLSLEFYTNYNHAVKRYYISDLHK